MNVRPFSAVRPTVAAAPRVAAVPYDVVDTVEAKALAAGNPASFLHVSRPEIDMPDGTDCSSPARATRITSSTAVDAKKIRRLYASTGRPANKHSVLF